MTPSAGGVSENTVPQTNAEQKLIPPLEVVPYKTPPLPITTPAEKVTLATGFKLLND